MKHYLLGALMSLLLTTNCASIHPIPIPPELESREDTRVFKNKTEEIKQLRNDISVYQWQKRDDYRKLQSWKRDPLYTIPLGACTVAAFTLNPFFFVCSAIIIWDAWLEG